MAKETGLGANFYWGGYDLSSDTGSLSKISKSLAPIPVTGISKSAYERLAGQLDAEIVWATYWNPTNAHLALKDRPRTDVVASYYHRPVLGSAVASMVAKQINYDPKRDKDGAFTGEVQALANAWWLDWGLALTAGIRVDTDDTSGTGVDFGAGASFGLQAYAHVFALTGTDITIKLQHSSDNGVGDAWADVTGGGFTAVTAAPGAGQRIETSRTQAVERYLRVVTSGAFTSASFAVAATINLTTSPL